MSETQPLHFSGKILVASFIFTLSVLAITALWWVIGTSVVPEPVVPQLLFATPESVDVKLSDQEDYQPASNEQLVYSGTMVRTGEKAFAELIFANNEIRLDESTEIKLLSIGEPNPAAYTPGSPRLKLELLSGSMWVNAFDPLEVMADRHEAQLFHSVGIITYNAPINRLMVVTGDLNLTLLSDNGQLLTDFVVPLGSQVTFIDTQITDSYAALKPSKLKKELKMTAIPEVVLEDEWVLRNAYDFEARREALKDRLITSKSSYKIKQFYQTMCSYLAFAPEAKRQTKLRQADNMLAYLLGTLTDESDWEQARVLIEDFDALVQEENDNPLMQTLIVETLYAIEKVAIDTPSYELRDVLMENVAEKEGEYVYRLYLNDLRRALYEKNTEAAKETAERWLAAWPSGRVLTSADEFRRQSQILNHIILSFAGQVPSEVLTVFDETGQRTMTMAKDIEEARFEVISDRLQITAALVAAYRYAEAKQYLKNSYLSLNIETLSSQLASTQIFLKTGELLAQRIEYAEVMLHGTAQPIDESEFMTYFETVRRDEALSADLKKFFELEEEELASEVEEVTKSPSASQVAGRFLDHGVNVNFADIALMPEAGFSYQITNARLIDRAENGGIISFDATYDYNSNSVTDVVTATRAYQGAFTLEDLITLLKSGGQLESQIPTPNLEGEIDLLITDEDKIAAQEGQAIAQDVARQLAYNQLKVLNIIIPEVKFDIEILDSLNLNRFHIQNALIPRADGQPAILIRFDYNATTEEVTSVVEKVDEETERPLLSSTPVGNLSEAVITAVRRLEAQANEGPKLPGSTEVK